jgi:hypothetical protein
MEPNFEPGLLAANPSKLVGQIFQFDGIIQVAGRKIDLNLNGDETCQIPILDPTLWDRLIDSAPPWVGGARLYNDPVWLRGRLSDEGGRIVIDLVLSGELRRPDDGTSQF